MSYSAFFDLEGPLSPQDNAYEVLSLAENGGKVFEVISRYDDILTLQGRENYEPGDTLKLILPFLVYYGITEDDIERVSRRAKVVPGAGEVVNDLRRQGWKVRVISTSYQQHAHNIGRRIGVKREDIACTALPLGEYHTLLGEEERRLIKHVEKRILEERHSLSDEKMARFLDNFFKELSGTLFGKAFNEIMVVGGQRKVNALFNFTQRDGTRISSSIAVGDSITDYKMLKTVAGAGGLAIAFNGNKYCIPYADVGIASEDLYPVLTFAEAYRSGGKTEARARARELGREDKRITWVKDAPLEEVISIHSVYRKKIRGEAGKLG